MRGLVGTCIVTVVIAAVLLAGWSVMRTQKAAFAAESAAVLELEEYLGGAVHVVRFTGVSPYRHVDQIQLPARSYSDEDFSVIVSCLESLPHCDVVEVADAELTQEQIRSFKSVLPENVRLSGGGFIVSSSGQSPMPWERVDR